MSDFEAGPSNSLSAHHTPAQPVIAELQWPQGVERWLHGGDREPIQIVDSHTQGNPTRIVLSGVAVPPHVHGVSATREWLRTEADHVRRRLVHEPRGGGLTCAVLPVADANPDPVDGWDIGAVILEPGSYPPMCGHCMIGFATVVVEIGLLPDLVPDSDGATRVRILTPAGVVTTIVRPDGRGAHHVSLFNVPSYPVLSTTCTVDGTEVPVDLLWGGDYYISVDTDALGLRPSRRDQGALVGIARQLRRQFESVDTLDPVTGEVLDVYQVMFYRQDQDAPSTWDTVVVAPPGQVDRSPCGTGTSALLAHLVARGDADINAGITTRSIVGGTFTATGTAIQAADRPGVLGPVVSASAYINGFHVVVADRADPFRDGFEPIENDQFESA